MLYLFEGHSPRADNFLVFIILAANSNPVDFWTHLRTIENAPLKHTQKRFMDYSLAEQH